jgi:hypothetical protein
MSLIVADVGPAGIAPVFAGQLYFNVPGGLALLISLDTVDADAGCGFRIKQ